jgi:hypothetical protein
MAYTIIPAQPVANQELSCILDGLLARITLTTTDYGLYADVLYNGVPVSSGQLCLDRTDINPNRYRGLPQFLGFADLQGIDNPTFDGFGTRFLLIYGNPPGN